MDDLVLLLDEDNHFDGIDSSSSIDTIRSDDEVYRCHLCPKSIPFESHSELRAHFKHHSQQNMSFSCQLCNGNFVSSTKLWQHLCKIHHVSKDFRCSLCKKDFRQSLNFHLHMLIHLGEQPERCKFCPKTFRTKPSLRKHELIHTGQKDFCCQLCPRQFKTRDEVKQHAQSHSVIKSFVCNFCSGRFKFAASLRRHEKKGRCRIGKHWCKINKGDKVEGVEERVMVLFKSDLMYGDVFFGTAAEAPPALEQIFSFT